MTLAELHGKSPLSGSEDFLTADVFTAFRYLPPGPGLIGFLRTIPGLADQIPDSGQAAAAIHFWPVGLSMNREPDVLIELEFPGRPVHIVVEAKYYSGPSDLEYDLLVGDESLKAGKQLGGEYLDLQNSHYRIFESGIRDHHLTLPTDPPSADDKKRSIILHGLLLGQNLSIGRITTLQLAAAKPCNQTL